MLGAFYRLWGRNFQQQKGTMDSDRGSMIDSEGQAEEELEEFEDVSEDDQRPKKKRPASFTDELAARIKVDMLSKLEEDQLSYAKNKKKASDKEDVPLDDDDIFMPPKLTDEGFLPFAKEGLFGGGTGLFDNEESDLFAELPKAEATVEKETQAPINDEPSTKVVRKVPAGAVSLFPGRNDVFSPSFLMGKEDKKLIESITDTAEKFHGNIGMFDDDEFKSNNADSLSAKPAPGLFDVEQELFKEKAVITNTVKNAATGNKEGTAGYKVIKQKYASDSNCITISKSLFSEHI
ncbi:WASH complex subunit 2C-like [Sceloporus undulatus]|uniref:WASH complex subunit 2C-like n=1 Tax=Sceloporus undulatus TaxID=8520 RepID=UPI001C4CFE04|nr:WASH complex subunit 2C-like [Sceloporus undulatus]